MTDTTHSASSVVYGVFDGSRATPAPLTPADAGASGDLIWSVPDGSMPIHPLPTHSPSPLPLAACPPGDGNPKKKGSVLLDADMLRELRESRMLSQEEMANLFEVRNIRISIATIKRAETCHPTRYRIAREFSRYFGVPVEALLKR
jgi:DNA-binding XRE family transcriptional regulator